jgi:hypothetical protein
MNPKENLMTNLVDAFFENPAFVGALKTWETMARGSPLTWNEPILPGWTINIDSNNSSSPAMERDILQMASYGKQLGRLSDAVAALVALRPEAERAEAPFKPFTDLQHDIARVKLRGIERRVARMAADLAQLKTSKHPKYAELSAQLGAVIAPAAR